MRIAVLDNLKENAPQSERPQSDSWAELSTAAEVQPIVEVLERAGHVAAFFEGNLALIETLPKFRPDLCFNICEGHFGESRESHMPALLEMLRLPYTGSGVLTLALTLDKVMTKRWLSFYGLPTPPYQVFATAEEALDPTLRFPLFVKPMREGSGMGVTTESIVYDEGQLRQRVGWLISVYRQPALVERYIRGREITLGLLGNEEGHAAPTVTHRREKSARASGLTALPAFEILFKSSQSGVYTHEIKSSVPDGWVAGQNYRCPAPIADDLRIELERLAKEAFLLTGCRDYARMDFRLDEEDNLQPYLLEVNALPGIVRGWSDMSLEATAAGLSYDELILSIVSHATRRLGIDVK